MTQLIADIRPPTVDTSGLNPEGVTRLTVIASPTLNQDQLWKLFDLIPGLDYCDLRKDHKSGQVYYHSCVTAGQGEGGREGGGGEGQKCWCFRSASWGRGIQYSLHTQHCMYYLCHLPP